MVAVSVRVPQIKSLFGDVRLWINHTKNIKNDLKRVVFPSIKLYVFLVSIRVFKQIIRISVAHLEFTVELKFFP